MFIVVVVVVAVVVVVVAVVLVLVLVVLIRLDIAKTGKNKHVAPRKKNLDFMVKVRPFFAKYPTMRPLMGIKHDWKSPRSIR